MSQQPPRTVESDVARRWARTRRKSGFEPSAPGEHADIARWVERFDFADRRHLTFVDGDVAIPIAFEHHLDPAADSVAPIVLPQPHETVSARHYSSYRAWIEADPRRHSPSLDYGVRWRSGGGLLDEWRVLWNTSTREMYAIHHTSDTRVGAVFPMGTCANQDHADAVVASLPALNQLVDHFHAAARRHRVGGVIGAEPPGSDGVAFTLYHHGVGGITTKGHVVRRDAIETAAQQHAADNTPEACQRRITGDTERHYRATAAWDAEYNDCHPEEFGGPPLSFEREAAATWHPGQASAMYAYARTGYVDDPVGLMSETLDTLDRIDANPDVFDRGEHEEVATLLVVAAEAATDPDALVWMAERLIARGITVGDEPAAAMISDIPIGVDPSTGHTPPPNRHARAVAAALGRNPHRPYDGIVAGNGDGSELSSHDRAVAVALGCDPRRPYGGAGTGDGDRNTPHHLSDAAAAAIVERWNQAPTPPAGDVAAQSLDL